MVLYLRNERNKNMYQLIKIKTEKRVFEFNLTDSPYASFASIIADGISNWTIDMSSIQVDLGSGSNTDVSFQIQGWVQISHNVLVYLQAHDFEQISNLLSADVNSEKRLEHLLNFE
jgi:hypothetical protein